MTDISVKSLAMLFESDGIESIVCTDIGKDGRMGGVKLHGTRDLANAVSTPIIASGGVSELRDVEALLEMERVDGGVMGVITGRALYEQTLDLAEAQAFCDNYEPS